MEFREIYCNNCKKVLGRYNIKFYSVDKIGDLIVRLHVQSHSQFKRDGADIFYDQPISMVDAVLGKEIQVPTLEGTEKIKAEQGTQPNTIVKLRGKGLPRQNSWGRGDQYVRLVVNIPKKTNKLQKQLLEDFKNSLD